MPATAKPPADAGRLIVGRVRGVHGLRGAVRVEILTDNSERFDPGSTLFREGSDSPLTVVQSQRDGPGLLVRFAELPDRNAADSLRNAYLEASSDSAPPADSHWWHEIIGCAVTTTSGRELGIVADVFRAGEGEVYVVHGEQGEILVPAVSSVVRELAPEQKRIVVDTDALGLE